MTTINHVEALQRLGACASARRFASDYPTLREAWFACPIDRSDWKAWLVDQFDTLYSRYVYFMGRLQTNRDMKFDDYQLAINAFLDVLFEDLEPLFDRYRRDPHPVEGDYIIVEYRLDGKSTFYPFAYRTATVVGNNYSTYEEACQAIRNHAKGGIRFPVWKNDGSCFYTPITDFVWKPVPDKFALDEISRIVCTVSSPADVAMEVCAVLHNTGRKVPQ